MTLLHIAFHTIEGLPPLRNELIMASHRGDTSIAVVLPPEGVRAWEPAPHVKVQPVLIALRRLSTRQVPLLKLLRFLEYMLRVFAAVLRHRADVVVAHDAAALLPAWFAARLVGRPILYHAHELWSDAGGGTAPWPALWRRVERFLCPRVDAMIAPEENRARIYAEEFGARTPPVVVRNCPMDRPRVESDDLRRLLAARGIASGCIVLYQGLLDPSRCLMELVDAMALTGGDATLVLLGRGDPDHEQQLHARINEPGLRSRVVLLPSVPYEELHAITCSADIGVLLYRNDSRNNYYCAPNKLYEYMQAGLSLLASDFPGLRQVIDTHSLGACADPADPRAIAAAIDRLTDEIRDGDAEARRARISAIARQHFRWEAEYEKIERVYEGCV